MTKKSKDVLPRPESRKIGNPSKRLSNCFLCGNPMRSVWHFNIDTWYEIKDKKYCPKCNFMDVR